VTARTSAKPAKRQRGKVEKAALRWALITAVFLAPALARHSLLLAVLGVLGLLALAAVRLAVAIGRYRQGGKAAMRRRAKHQGWAGWREIRKKLSPAAARRSARLLYPAVHPARVHVTIGRTKGIGPVKGKVIAGTRADTYLLLAPPQTFKTALLSDMAAGAPGALLATSSRGDIWRHTAMTRPGGARVLNASGTPGIPNDFAWSPVPGCKDPVVATRRAADLMAASPRDPGGRDAWHEDRGGRMLRYMLHTADLVGADMHDVRDWIQNALSGHALHILAAEGSSPRWANALESLIRGSGEHIGSVITSAEAALGWMDDPVMAAAACPAPGDGIDAAEFVTGNGSVYLISEDREQSSPAPYFAAFTAEVFCQARARAERSGGRLPVPLTLALDELPTIVPVPFHKWSSVAAGYNICLIGGVQSPSQLPERWGEKNARTIWTNSKIKVIGGGFTGPDDLETLSRLCGDVDTWHQADDGTRVHETRRLCPPERIRLLDAGKWECLVLHRNARPVVATITPVWDRPGYQPAVVPVPSAVPQRPAVTPAPARVMVPARMQRLIATPVRSRPAPRALPPRRAIGAPARPALAVDTKGEVTLWPAAKAASSAA
jgi:hypothetical protein